ESEAVEWTTRSLIAADNLARGIDSARPTAQRAGYVQRRVSSATEQKAAERAACIPHLTHNLSRGANPKGAGFGRTRCVKRGKRVLRSRRRPSAREQAQHRCGKHGVAFHGFELQGEGDAVRCTKSEAALASGCFGGRANNRNRRVTPRVIAVVQLSELS